MGIILMRRLVLHGTVCVLAAAGLVGASAGPAGATAPAAPAASVQQLRVTATDPVATPDTVATVDTETTTMAEANDNTGNFCRTGWVKLSYRDVFGVVLFWFKMTTYWCYNFQVVTTHSTSETAGITATGSATGWSYRGIIEHSFHCYVASGSTRSCSGNFEDAQGSFQACLITIGCYASKQSYIHEEENYKGQFFWGT